MASSTSASSQSPLPSPLPPAGVVRVRETLRRQNEVAWLSHPEWEEAFPWLVQGTTVRESGDMALFGRGSAGPAQRRWERLLETLGMREGVHGHQVHGPVVRVHREGGGGLRLVDGTDGHVTRATSLLLGVATADCIPVTVVDPGRQAVAMLHAGWRGVVAGVVERGALVMRERLASTPRDLHLHLGPAICGSCYEVGPEVYEALDLPVPAEPTPVDLRAAVARRAVDAGFEPSRISMSSLCTRCDAELLFSHRGGCVERQVGFAGVVS